MTEQTISWTRLVAVLTCAASVFLVFALPAQERCSGSLGCYYEPWWIVSIGGTSLVSGWFTIHEFRREKRHRWVWWYLVLPIDVLMFMTSAVLAVANYHG